MRRRYLLTGFTAVLMFWGHAAAAAGPGSCSGLGTDKTVCQYEVMSNTQAPLPTGSGPPTPSLGIRFNHNVTNILFNSYPGQPQTLCWFADNNGHDDLFVPQSTANEFRSFVNKHPPLINVTFANCVLPVINTGATTEAATAGVSYTTYTITANDGPIVSGSGLQTGITDIPIPQLTSSPQVNSIARMTNPAPTASLIKDGGNNPLVFNYTRSDCDTASPPNCSPWPVREQQTITLTAQQTGSGDGVWANPVISSQWQIEYSPGAWTPISGPTDGYRNCTVVNFTGKVINWIKGAQIKSVPFIMACAGTVSYGGENTACTPGAAFLDTTFTIGVYAEDGTPMGETNVTTEGFGGACNWYSPKPATYYAPFASVQVPAGTYYLGITMDKSSCTMGAGRCPVIWGVKTSYP